MTPRKLAVWPHSPHLRAWGMVALPHTVTVSVWVVWRDPPQGQAMRIDGASAYSDTPWPSAMPKTGTAGQPFVTSVSPDHRYFLDQYGEPILIKSDAPCSLMTDLSPAQAERYFSTRQQRGATRRSSPCSAIR
jgi:hypothetical protein